MISRNILKGKKNDISAAGQKYFHAKNNNKTENVPHSVVDLNIEEELEYFDELMVPRRIKYVKYVSKSHGVLKF